MNGCFYVSNISAGYPLSLISALHLSSLLNDQETSTKETLTNLQWRCICNMTSIMLDLQPMAFLNALKIYNHCKQFCQVSLK